MKKPGLIILLIFIGSYTLAKKPLEKVSISVDLSRGIGEMKPVWARFGYDEPNYTYMKDGKKLLSELSALSSV